MTYTDKAFHFSMCFTATVLLMRLGLTRRGAISQMVRELKGGES